MPVVASRIRRLVIVVSAAALAVGLTSALTGGDGRPAAAAASRPNLVVFLTDDQRATDTLQVMPQTRSLFAAGGTTFVNAFDATPLCCPARAALYSGRYSHNNGVRVNLDAPLLDQRSTVQRQLQQAGYRTGYVGKFLNNWALATPPPYFDRWATLRDGYVNPMVNLNGTVKRINGYTTDILTAQATTMMKAFAAEGRPWLIVIAPDAPHHPYVPPARYATAPVPPWAGNPAVTEADRSDKPPWVRSLAFTAAQAEQVRVPQLRTLMAVDDLVGSVEGTVTALGQAANTLSVYTTDNGYVWADHKAGGDYGTAGQKRYPYTPSIGVPLLLRWPGHVTAGRTDARLVANVDIAPTLLAAAGVTPDPAYPMDGRSLLGSQARSRLLLEYWNDQGAPRIPSWKSVRTSAYQYVEYYTGSSDETLVSFREYYDLVADPWQLVNLLKDGKPGNDPDVASLSAQLWDLQDCRGTTGPDGCP